MPSIRAAIGVGAALLALTACGGDTEPVASDALDDEAITIGSFDFPESVLLAELYSQALEGNGIPVIRAFGLGPREFVGPALDAGLIELVPEYAGTAVAYFSAGDVAPSADPSEAHRELADVVDGTPITALDSSSAQNPNTFVVTAGCDGLYWHSGDLVGVQNVTNPGRVIRIALGDQGTRISAITVLQSHHDPEFAEPTTGAIAGDALFVIANSYVGHFQPNRSIKDAGQLKPTAIIAVPLKSLP